MQFYQNETKLKNVKITFMNPKLLTIKFKNSDFKCERVFYDYYDFMEFLFEKEKEGLQFESAQLLPYRKRGAIELELKTKEKVYEDQCFNTFIKSYIDFTGNQEDFIECTKLYEIYNEVFPGLTQSIFTKKLKASCTDIVQKQKRINGYPTQIFIGIKIKPDYHH